MNLLEVVIETSTQQLVRLAPGGLQEEEYKPALEALRLEIETGYPLLRAELEEAREAFFGNEQILRTVMAVGCADLAARAIVKLRAMQRIEVQEFTRLEGGRS